MSPPNLNLNLNPDLNPNLSNDGPMSESAVCERLERLQNLDFKGTYTIEFTEGMRGGLTQEEP